MRSLALEGGPVRGWLPIGFITPTPSETVIRIRRGMGYVGLIWAGCSPGGHSITTPASLQSIVDQRTFHVWLTHGICSVVIGIVLF
jgi:hypothetical protein